MCETDSLRLVLNGAAINNGMLELILDRTVNGIAL